MFDMKESEGNNFFSLFILYILIFAF